MAQAQALAGENYEFKAAPEVVRPKPKYRQQPLQSSDDQKQVVHCWEAISCLIKGQSGEILMQVQINDTQIIQKPQQKAAQQPQTTYLHPSTPRPFQNRVNIDIQTDEYLEILTDKPPEQEMDAQTDYYIDKPPDRLFVPKKNGIDKETQIWEGDLFDFDQEVEPILQVLMNKILEQSRMEVLEEEEIKLMKHQQKQHEKQKTSVLSEMQRLEAVQQRLDQEEARRKLQYETFQKYKSKAIKNSLQKSIKISYKSPQIKYNQEVIGFGCFRDPLETALLYEYIPWVYENVLSQLVDENDNASNFNNILNNMEETITIEHSNSLKRRQQQIDDKYEEIARKREKIEKRMEEERRLKEIEDQRLAEEEAARQAEQEILDQQQENQQQQQLQS